MAILHPHFIRKWLIRNLIFVALGSMFVFSAQANRASQATSPVKPLLSKTKQKADRLLAVTKAGYYKALLVSDRTIRRITSPRARAGTADICKLNCVQSPMPVKLIRFSGERVDEKQVKLTWTTSEEVNNDYFGIQRSRNPALGFETIASVKGMGTSDKAVTYQTLDTNTYTNYTYYRLKQVDLDGSYVYSQIIAVKGGLPVLTVKAFPNPGQAREVAFQVIGLQETESVSVVLYDSQGRVLYQQDGVTTDSNQRLAAPDLSGIQPGNYYLKVKATNQQATTSFILLR